MSFKAAVESEYKNGLGLTDNGAVTHLTSGKECVDLFFLIGASRNNPAQVVSKFASAFNENPEAACRILCYARDIRGGMGERNVFRSVICAMQHSSAYHSWLRRIIAHTALYGRWDDLLVLNDPEFRSEAFDCIAHALLKDKDALCAKWMPRKGEIAVALRKHMGLTPKSYRKLLVGLSDTVEQDMCAKEWESINYSHVPSVAAARYQKAFTRNDEKRYMAYRASLVKGEKGVKINAQAIYPYQVLQAFNKGDKIVSAEQWKALPDYLSATSKIIPLVDTSGSMDCNVGGNTTALEVAVSLGLYVADKQKGPFKDMVLNFNSDSRLYQLKGSFADKVRQTYDLPWGGSTNLQSAFDSILSLAVKHNIPAADMPDTLLIISDMEFNTACPSSVSFWDNRLRRYNTMNTNHNAAIAKYKAAGYAMPRIVYWNVNGRIGNSPVKVTDDGTALVSGFSPAILKAVLACDFANFTPAKIVLDAIDIPRYAIFGKM